MISRDGSCFVRAAAFSDKRPRQLPTYPIALRCSISRFQSSVCLPSCIRRNNSRETARSENKRNRVCSRAMKLCQQRCRQSVNSFTRRSSSAAEGTINSAAALGVGARRSATKSAIVKSTSCPTAETIGTTAAAIARATISSLNSHKSSMLPPPRAMTIKSSAGQIVLGLESSLMADAISVAAPMPCTRTGLIRISMPRPRRRKMLRMSRMAAPLGEVTIPIRFGNRGSGFLRAGSNKPSASNLRLSASNFACNNPRPRGCTISTLSWYWPRASKTLRLP